MRTEDITVEVRDKQLNRVGIILPEDLDLEVSGLNSDNGSWTMRLSASHPMVATLLAPGSSITADLEGLRFSGPTLNEECQSSPEATPELSVVIKGRAFKS